MKILAIDSASNVNLKKTQNNSNNYFDSQSSQISFEGAPATGKLINFIAKQGLKIQRVALKISGKNEALLKSYKNGKNENEMAKCLKVAYKIEQKADKYSIDKNKFSSQMKEFIESELKNINVETGKDDIQIPLMLKKGKYVYEIYDVNDIFEVSRCHFKGQFL